MHTHCESASTLELQGQKLATSAVIGRCWRCFTGQQQCLLLDSASRSYSLVLCYCKLRLLLQRHCVHTRVLESIFRSSTGAHGVFF